MNKIKEKTLEIIVNDALELFLKNSIASVRIKDVANASGIGEATVYRYFSTKLNILEKCAVNLQNRVYEEYFRLVGKTGHEKVSAFYSGYHKIFIDHPEFYRFIRELDAFVIDSGGSLEEYSKGVDLFKNEFLTAYGEGLNDGSIRKTTDIETFYYSTTHALLELCKKLALNGKVVKQDEKIKKDNEIQTLSSIILSALKS